VSKDPEEVFSTTKILILHYYKIDNNKQIATTERKTKQTKVINNSNAVVPGWKNKMGSKAKMKTK